MDFGFWSLDFGFWILDFGLDEALPDIVWILHKIFPCHADSGRRIYIYTQFERCSMHLGLLCKQVKGSSCIEPDPANVVQGRAARVAAATATGEEPCKHT